MNTLSNIIPTAEPFFFPGGPTGCLLIHGFTGTPKEMRWMGEYLANEGYTVLGVRLAGHATRPMDMLRMRWTDWVTSVEDGWHFLRGVTECVFAIGLSMGGALSLLIASQYPLAGVVAMSTPYDLPHDPRLPFIKILRWIYPFVPKGPPDWHDPESALEHVSYPTYPTRAIVELRDLLATMRAALPKVIAPVLLIHSRQDRGVDPDNMQKIYNHLGCSDRRMLWVDNCGHVITREPERLGIFQATADFIAEVREPSP